MPELTAQDRSNAQTIAGTFPYGSSDRDHDWQETVATLRPKYGGPTEGHPFWRELRHQMLAAEQR